MRTSRSKVKEELTIVALGAVVGLTVIFTWLRLIQPRPEWVSWFAARVDTMGVMVIAFIIGLMIGYGRRRETLLLLGTTVFLISMLLPHFLFGGGFSVNPIWATALGLVTFSLGIVIARFDRARQNARESLTMS